MEIAKTIQSQLMGLGKVKVWSWGANSWVGGNDFLQFKVQGFLLKGSVRITLNGLDLYDIVFKNTKNEVVNTLNDVFAEDMVDLIDAQVEYTGEHYKNDVTKAVYRF